MELRGFEALVKKKGHDRKALDRDAVRGYAYLCHVFFRHAVITKELGLVSDDPEKLYGLGPVTMVKLFEDPLKKDKNTYTFPLGFLDPEKVAEAQASFTHDTKFKMVWARLISTTSDLEDLLSSSPSVMLTFYANDDDDDDESVAAYRLLREFNHLVCMYGQTGVLRFGRANPYDMQDTT